MNRLLSKRIFPIVMGVLVLLQARCTFPDSPKSEPAPTLSLHGRWRLDSGNVTFYDSRKQFLNHLWNDPTAAVGFVTIGPNRWHYSDGRFRSASSYTRHGDTLVIQRLADTALVRGRHARWEDLGKPIGQPDTSVIAVLTAHSWVLLDSTQDSDGTIIRVFRSYYSR